jgi:uncharacterized iron-regulated protein
VVRRKFKDFFFEKKKQKTFATAPTARRILHHPCAAPFAKVFWFFFSKKNCCLLPFLALAACTMQPACAPPNTWLAPGSLTPLADPLPQAATAPVVLLGEQHDSAADHHWQLDTIERLYALNPHMALGFEMFPRSSQAALNDWVAGSVTEAEFLKRSDWQKVWGFDADLYLPIFRFAREHHVPMLALNVSRHAVHLVATKGWAALSPAEREGVATPAAPTPAYRASLQDAMSGHAGPSMTPERLNHFIEAQLFWDRAMAEGIAAERTAAPDRTVVAIMGAGHIENGDGVPHQLAALGIAATLLLPVHGACSAFAPGYATAVFVE